jgi:hypothetical protein
MLLVNVLPLSNSKGSDGESGSILTLQILLPPPVIVLNLCHRHLPTPDVHPDLMTPMF